MPAFGSAFSSEEMRAIVDYIRGLKPGDAARMTVRRDRVAQRRRAQCWL